jgi:hypothetical protein
MSLISSLRREVKVPILPFPNFPFKYNHERIMPRMMIGDYIINNKGLSEAGRGRGDNIRTRYRDLIEKVPGNVTSWEHPIPKAPRRVRNPEVSVRFS